MAKIGRGTPRVMRLFEAQTDNPDLQEMIKSMELQTTDEIRAVLEFVRKDVLYFLKGYTNIERPPRYQRKFTYDQNLRRIQVPKSDRSGWRPAHPGGWADVSEDLKKKYKTNLEFTENSWKLTISNDSDHAAYVEAMDGFFVVHGVLEPNGPVAKSIRRALTALGVKWVLRAGDFGMGEGVATSLHATPRSGKAGPPSEMEFDA